MLANASNKTATDMVAVRAHLKIYCFNNLGNIMSKTSDFIDSMTPQEVFDFIVNHMKKQQQQSVGSFKTGVCLYRSGELKCAAGCLIHDDDYDSSMENCGWIEIARRLKCREKHNSLILSMQLCHDRNNLIIPMLEAFRLVAKIFGLDDGVIDS